MNDPVFKIEDEETAYEFPSFEFAEFLEHKIIKIDVRLQELEDKFKQL